MRTPNVLAPYGTNATDNTKQSYHYVIELDGPTGVTLEVDSGEEVFIDGLIAGDYIVSCKAFIDDEVRFFGQTKATVEIGKTKSVPLKLEIHNHVGNGKYFSDENNHWELCECGKVVNKADHSGDWVTTDSDLHWKECRCGKKFDESNHDWKVTVKTQPTKEADGENLLECKVCGKNKTVNVPYDHTCSFGDWINTDPDKHWKECECGEKSEEAVHIFDSWTTTFQPTEDAEGKQESDCTICKYHAEKTVPKLEHVHACGTYHAATNGNCVDKGTIEYYDCSKSTCTVKLDSTGKPISSIDGSLNPSVHKGTETVWTKTANSHKETYKCCGAVKTSEAAHTWNNGEITKKPTTTATGVKTYTCTVCEYTKTEPLPKIDYSTCCVVGDIILKDGSICKVDDYDSSTNSAAAVIVRAASGTTPALGVGLKQSSGAWCLNNAEGYNKSVALLANIEDGSSGWTILKSSCSDAASNPESYPAWNFSLTYARESGLTGDLANGWYLPTESELQTIFKNKTTVNESLTKAGGTTLKSSPSYWSSTQGSLATYACSIDSNGTPYSSTYKTSNCNICSVRAFK